jgi:parvulin-like peptidyl-prolyl isomerase
MLKSVRIAAGIMLVLSVATVLTAQTKPNPKGIVGKINTKTYTYTEYNGLLSNYWNYWQSRDGKKLTTERKQELNNQCWEELIGRAVYDAEIKRRGLVITDTEAYDSVIKNPPAQVKQIEGLKTNGKFDMEKFKKALEMDAKFKTSVLNLVKETMVYDKLFRVIKSAVKAKPDSIKQVWLKDNNLASARIIYFDFTKVKNISVADSEATSYYGKNKETFIRDPARKYKFVKFTQDMYADRSKSKIKADSIYQAIKAGGDFAALATMFSDDPGSGKNGGDVGFFTREKMVKPFSDTAFALEINAISEPVKSQFGWHIIQTLEKRKNEQGQDEVKARHILIKSEPEDAIKKLMSTDAELFLAAAKEQGFSSAAAKMNYVVAETREFYEKNKGIQEFAGAPDLVTAAFTNPVGFIPPSFTSRSGDIFVCQVSDSLGIHYSPFETEQAGIVRTLEREKKIAANKALARDFYNKHQGGDYLAFAAQDSITIVDAVDVKDGSNIPGISTIKALNDSLLATEEGQYTKLVENETNAYLALVTKRVKPNLASWEKQKAKLIAEANEKLKTQHLNNWYYAQRQKMKVEDNRKDFYELPKPKSNVQNIQLNP